MFVRWKKEVIKWVTGPGHKALKAWRYLSLRTSVFNFFRIWIFILTFWLEDSKCYIVSFKFEFFPTVSLNREIVSLISEQKNIVLRFLCSGTNHSHDYQPLFVKWAHAFSLYGRIKDHTRVKKSGSTSLTIGFVIQKKNDPKGPFLNNGVTALEHMRDLSKVSISIWAGNLNAWKTEGKTNSLRGGWYW